MDCIGESHSIAEENALLSSELTTHMIHLNRLVKTMMSMQECQLVDTNKYRVDFDTISSKYKFERYQLELKEKIKRIKSMRYTEEYKPDERVAVDSPSPFGYSSSNRSGESSVVPAKKNKPLYQLRPISARSDSNKEMSDIVHDKESSQKAASPNKKSVSASPATEPLQLKPPDSARLKTFALKESTLSKIVDARQKELVADIFILMKRNSQLPSSLPDELNLVDKLEFIHKFVQRYQ